MKYRFIHNIPLLSSMLGFVYSKKRLSSRVSGSTPVPGVVLRRLAEEIGSASRRARHASRVRSPSIPNEFRDAAGEFVKMGPRPIYPAARWAQPIDVVVSQGEWLASQSLQNLLFWNGL